MPLSVFFGGFADKCSGLSKYTIELLSAPSKSSSSTNDNIVVWTLTQTHDAASHGGAGVNVRFPTGTGSFAAGVQGKEYVVRVTATSAAGKKASATSAKLIIDNTPPRALLVDVTWRGRAAASDAPRALAARLSPNVTCLPSPAADASA